MKVDSFDDRDRLAEAVYLDFFLCPFRTIPNGVLESSTTRYVQSGYLMHFGAALDRANPKSNMLRIGDVARYQGKNHAVLVSDLEREAPIFNNYLSGHPDTGSILNLEESGNPDYTSPAYYVNRNATVRGTIDRNFLMDDGSVLILNNLTIGDPRYHRVRWWPSQTNLAAYTFLPTTD